MDTSETYIKMCEKAGEIQAYRYNPRRNCFDQGDFYIHKNRAVIDCMESRVSQGIWPHPALSIHCNCDRVEEWEQPRNCIWLPRQDQLQEMVKDKCVYLEYFVPNSGTPVWGISSFSNYVEDCMWFNSAEKAWLAFVMKECYNKVGNGEDWEVVRG